MQETFTILRSWYMFSRGRAGSLPAASGGFRRGPRHFLTPPKNNTQMKRKMLPKLTPKSPHNDAKSTKKIITILTSPKNEKKHQQVRPPGADNQAKV